MGENYKISSSFDYKLFSNQTLNFDTTNRYELASTFSIMTFEIILFFYIIENFRKIFQWYFSEKNINPKRLFCINSNLLLSVCLRILDHMYQIIGYLVSFNNFNEKTPEERPEQVLFNVFIHIWIEIVYISLQNLTFFIAGKFLIKIISFNYLSFKKWGIRLSIFWWVTTIGEILTIINIFIIGFINGRDLDWPEKFIYIAIISSSAMSSIVFLTSCIIVHKDICLLSFQSYRKHANKYKYIGILIICLQIYRFIYLILCSSYEEKLIYFKSSNNGKKFGDKGPNWALLCFFYTLITDTIPVALFSYLFKPKQQTKIQTFSSDLKFSESLASVESVANDQ